MKTKILLKCNFAAGFEKYPLFDTLTAFLSQLQNISSKKKATYIFNDLHVPDTFVIICHPRVHSIVNSAWTSVLPTPPLS